MRFLPGIKKAALILAKVYVVYLALIVLWVDYVLFLTASPRFFFERQPFIQAAAITLTIGAAVASATRSKTPALFSAFCLAYAALYFVFPVQSAPFIALFCLLAAVSFLYRNRITEPFLVMLLVIAGAWVFISLIYPSYLVGWANYVTGRKDLAGAIFEGFAAVKDQLVSTSLMIPVLAMYILGKRGYANFCYALRNRFQGKKA